MELERTNLYSLSIFFPCLCFVASREKILVETAGIAGGVTLTVLVVVILSISYYSYVR